jgi:8-amino-7-oxononanoate synthase
VTSQEPSPWANWTESELDAIRGAGRWRANRTFDAHGPRGLLGSQPVVSFASNDYLGLSTHPAVAAAAHDAIDRWGTGATAARLIVGTRPGHQELEAEIAEWKGCERALVFSTGYAANVGVLATFGGRDVTVLSDELNHASIIDGCTLSRSAVQVFRHGDVGHVGELLASTSGRRIVVTDAVFSMDGDVAPLGALADVCAQHGALLVVDEAHVIFDGQSPVPAEGLDLLRVGTLSKTLGSLGGWVAGSQAMIDLLVNRARSFIFTTGLSPADAASALAALRIVRSDEGAALVAALRTSIDRFRPGHPSPIIPIVLGSEERAIEAAAGLLRRGLFVPAIRPPTVPAGTSRLRLTLSAAHDATMIDHLLDSLSYLGLA